MLRTHTCGELNKKYIGKKASLCGWVATKRDHGGVLFIDLRDRYGVTQIVFNPKDNPGLHSQAERLGIENVIKIEGKTRQRPEGTVNKNIETGEIEIVAEVIEVLNVSETPPFEIMDVSKLSEELRYKYRYLDLRRPKMQKNLLLRHAACKIMRDFLDKHDFTEVETPILTKSTPEGARDYLVPSRINIGKFYALPQSPQLFKQMLMVAGLDRYYQISRCFRDEDLRADRQPEFTQLDLEMSFVEEDDIFDITEGVLGNLFKKILDYDIRLPLERMTYQEAYERFGTDKPDRRFGLELVDITKEVEGGGFKIFLECISHAGIIKGLNLKDSKDISGSKINSLIDFVKGLGGGGLVYFKVKDGKLASPAAKFLNEQIQTKIIKKMQARDEDLLLFVAGKRKLTDCILDALRRKLADEKGLINKRNFEFLWITDFPLFAYNEDEKRWESEHHPFTAPKKEDEAGLDKKGLSGIKARSYDLVVNGIEIGSGSIRIHNQNLQMKIFKTLGIAEQEAKAKFGFMIEAFKFGAPPHGGIALGLDRLITILTGCTTIRDVIAFPKTQRAVCPLTDAPSGVSEAQLKELGLKLKE